jgi:multidrug efflux pump subunit AcrA (membrane-fusion protein)
VGPEDEGEPARPVAPPSKLTEPMPAVSAAEPIWPAAEPAKPTVAIGRPAPTAKKSEPRPAVESVTQVEGGGGALRWVLIAVLLAAVGGAAYYFLVYNKDEGSGPTRVKGTPKAPTSMREPGTRPARRPAPPSAALEESAAAPVEVPAIADGVVGWLAAAGDAVAAGAPVAKLKGYERAEAEIAKHKNRLDFYERELAKLTAKAAPQAQLDATTAKVTEKKDLVVKAEEALAAFVMKAPVAGTAEPLVEPGSTVAKGAPVVKIAGAKQLTARFRGVPANKFQAPGASCRVVAQKAPDHVVACTVIDVAGDTVTVNVQPEAGLAAGTTIVLK